MSCCRANGLLKRVDRSPTGEAITICQQIAKLGNALPLVVSAAGELIIAPNLNPNKMSANVLFRTFGCRGLHIQRILQLELQLVSRWSALDVFNPGTQTTLGTVIATANL